MLFGSRLNRLATSIRRGISKYSVGSDNPGLVFDFIDNFYQKDKNQTVNFDGAITHVRNGNAVMTDGYGPELVVNGGFESDVSGWEASGSVAQSNQKAVIADVGGTDGYISQEISTVSGTTYVVEYNLSAVTNRLFLKIGTSENGNNILQESDTATGRYSYTFTATGSSTWITFLAYDANHSGAVDNVSVREMPVLKWGPHNLLPYSEDFSTSWVTTNSTPTASQSDPFGGTSATKITADTIGSFVEVRNNITGYANTKTTVSAIFKAIGVSSLTLRLRDVASVSNRMDYALNISSGTGTASVAGTYSSASGEITDLGDGWYKANLTATTGSNTSQRFDIYISSANVVSTGDFLIADAHAFRSDLGGMVDNPDQPLSRASYVPTTSSAKYLPRIGHHVYNGSAWVNEGLLAESELRTNLINNSNQANTLSINTDGALSATDSTEVASPAGSGTVIKLDKTSSGYGYARFSYTGITDTQTFSIFVKKGTARYIGLRTLVGTPTHTTFDLDTGTFVVTTGSVDRTAVEVGNGWYRLSITNSASSQWASVAITNASGGETNTETGTAYVFGFQRELGATPSSYIPTSGSGVTRAAETFTIPSANLPWPSPNYIGSELVTNGTFDTDSNWTKPTGVTISGGEAIFTAVGNGQNFVQSAGSYPPVVDGTTYLLTFEIKSISAGSLQAMVGARAGATFNTIGIHQAVVVASSNQAFTGLKCVGVTTATIDNVSVREIDPLSVSIAMDGRMTYADEGATPTAEWYRWYQNSSNNIGWDLSTITTRTGEVAFQQIASGTSSGVTTGQTEFSPDINVPYSIASRHGSTFINGAVDGVALTADTTPTALPDLSATDLNLAYDYMGTIGTFRVWDKDLGDTGIVEATNPSLEPSLSLDFLGTGTTSFTVSDWSE